MHESARRLLMVSAVAVLRIPVYGSRTGDLVGLWSRRWLLDAYTGPLDAALGTVACRCSHVVIEGLSVVGAVGASRSERDDGWRLGDSTQTSLRRCIWFQGWCLRLTSARLLRSFAVVRLVECLWLCAEMKSARRLVCASLPRLSVWIPRRPFLSRRRARATYSEHSLACGCLDVHAIGTIWGVSVARRQMDVPQLCHPLRRASDRRLSHRAAMWS
jgi:hypothetical protein